jgi:hypothetical protein
VRARAEEGEKQTGRKKDGEREGKNELDRAAGWDRIRQTPGEKRIRGEG